MPSSSTSCAGTHPLMTLNRVFIILLFFVLLCSCAIKQPEPEPAVLVTPQIQPALSPLPLDNLTDSNYRFAQAVLQELGYNIVYIDGIWGPKSAAAIRQFEIDNQLVTANGRLSELNFTQLSESSDLKQQDFVVSKPLNQKTGIASKLDTQIPLSYSPQLIITDLVYLILIKPNPYSETVTKLPAGAGLYIISLQEGWYEVETLERQRGYIKE